jgi:ABC-type transport system involved in multi-copper enzyme maturation permease subunit
MNALHVARDVVREAFASKLMLLLFLAIGVFLLLLTFSLDLDVVDGALAGSRLFGESTEASIVPVDVFLRPAFQALAWATFYFGLLFGIVVTADIAPRMLQPGRVEHLLALPVRRVELVLGIYGGVLFLCATATVVATGGVSLVLFVKAKTFTVAPAAGAGMAMIGFGAIYAVMLATGSLVRSAAVSAGAGLSLYVLGVVVASKGSIVAWITSRPIRAIVDVVLTPLPNLRALADVGAGVAAGEQVALAAVVPVVGGALAFAAFAVVVACAVVQSKNY